MFFAIFVGERETIERFHISQGLFTRSGDSTRAAGRNPRQVYGKEAADHPANDRRVHRERSTGQLCSRRCARCRHLLRGAPTSRRHRRLSDGCGRTGDQRRCRSARELSAARPLRRGAHTRICDYARTPRRHTKLGAHHSAATEGGHMLVV